MAVQTKGELQKEVQRLQGMLENADSEVKRLTQELKSEKQTSAELSRKLEAAQSAKTFAEGERNGIRTAFESAMSKLDAALRELKPARR